jgi:chemotaxis protein CheD
MLPRVSGFEHKVVVGIADLAVSNNPNVILTTFSLGSCLGIAIYDPAVKVGGLLHIMLPDSSIEPAKGVVQPAMFVDTGVPALLAAASKLRADKQRMLVYVAGGAQVMDHSGFFEIGKRNYEALGNFLQKNSLCIQAEQVGGLVNRTLRLNVGSGKVSLKISGQAEEISLC